MRTLITGSFAYDTIMVFKDQFKNHILPEQVHILNVSFFVPEMRREFGGCAGNISWNLHLLGGHAVPMGATGEDFAPYRKHLNEAGLNDEFVTEIPNTYTAQAFLTTDIDNNQIIAFHPGAMSYAHHNKVSDAGKIDLGIVAPDGREAMIEHAAQFAEAGIPFFFDPGQGLPMFSGEELGTFIDRATWLCVNDYESKMLMEKTGKSLEELARGVEALIVTRGAKGSDVYTNSQHLHIGPIAVSQVRDPTGCGDAFRAGLLFGVANRWDWLSTGRLASLMGGVKIEQPGTQNHMPTKSDLEARYRENFGDEITLG